MFQSALFTLVYPIKTGKKSTYKLHFRSAGSQSGNKSSNQSGNQVVDTKNETEDAYMIYHGSQHQYQVVPSLPEPMRLL